jgi:hypothetical protein
MSDLVRFTRQLKERLTVANPLPHWEPGEAESYMVEVTALPQMTQQVCLI